MCGNAIQELNLLEAKCTPGKIIISNNFSEILRPLKAYTVTKYDFLIRDEKVYFVKIELIFYLFKYQSILRLNQI